MTNSLKEQLSKLLVDTGRKKQITLTDEEERVYLVGYRYWFMENKIILDEIYITPTRTGGFKKMIACLVELGVASIIIAKVVNANLAEYLFNDKWTLKSSKYGNWIEFHKSY